MKKFIKPQTKIDSPLNKVYQETLNYQFPIAIKNRNKYIVHGTCIAITSGDVNFLITASHVTHLRKKSQDQKLYFFNYLENEFIKITGDIVEYPYDIPIPNDSDISVIKIQKDYYKIPIENFLNLGGIYIDYGDLFDRLYGATGYLAAKNTSFPKYKSNPNFFCFLTDEAKPSESRPSNISTLNVNYVHPAAPSPIGFSGGGLWIFTKELPRNPALAALLVCWIPNEKILISVKMEYVIALIKCYFPGSNFDNIHTNIHIKKNLIRPVIQ